MLIEEQLRSLLQNRGIAFYNALSEIEDTNTIRIECFEDFIAFVKEQNINCVFYQYEKTDQDNFLIDDDTFSFLKDEFYIDKYTKKVLKPEIDKHNEKIRDVNFGRPCYLHIWCIYCGVFVEYKETDQWFNKERIYPAEDVLREMIHNRENEIENVRKTEKERAQKKIEILKEYVLNDPMFHKCTNQHLRTQYGYRFIKEHPEYDELFLTETNTKGENLLAVVVFFNNIWKEYKYNKSK